MGWNETPYQPGDGEHRASAKTADPIRDLESLSPLLLNPDLRSVVADSFSSEKWDIVEEIIAAAERLRDTTRWDDEELLRRLGCRVRSFDDFRAVELDRLQNCSAFLSLVNELTDVVGPVDQQREVVRVCVDLLEDRTAASAVDLRLLLVLEADQWSAAESMRLGEISRAARLVRSLAGATRSTERRTGAHPFAGAAAVHLSTPRIDLYVAREVAVLGVDVDDRITAHLGSCSACRDAVQTRAVQLRSMT
ncbi:hypothetical protein [Baekduia sp. Peel2402]|uniref:hypothetical protein n=1 Tax=Baekduia sp. Peel2402 TaxID=3458296 RepID=UPI00403EAD69